MNAIQSTSLAFKSRREAFGSDPAIFADIYQEDTNIAVWQREPSDTLVGAARSIIKQHPTLKIAFTVTPENAKAVAEKILGCDPDVEQFYDDIAYLVSLFCCLFDLKQAGVRLTVLSQAMCPRFHVDQVPCRLVTTYIGDATQWLPHAVVDRSKLGAGNLGLSDELSGIYGNQSDLQDLRQGEVALLKGERWEGNEGAGLVHRSPQLETAAERLLLTLDFA